VTGAGARRQGGGAYPGARFGEIARSRMRQGLCASSHKHMCVARHDGSQFVGLKCATKTQLLEPCADGVAIVMRS